MYVVVHVRLWLTVHQTIIFPNGGLSQSVKFLIPLPTEHVFKKLSPAERGGGGGQKSAAPIAFIVLLLITHTIRPSPSANRFFMPFITGQTYALIPH